MATQTQKDSISWWSGDRGDAFCVFLRMLQFVRPATFWLLATPLSGIIARLLGFSFLMQFLIYYFRDGVGADHRGAAD